MHFMQGSAAHLRIHVHERALLLLLRPVTGACACAGIAAKLPTSSLHTHTRRSIALKHLQPCTHHQARCLLPPASHAAAPARMVERQAQWLPTRSAAGARTPPGPAAPRSPCAAAAAHGTPPPHCSRAPCTPAGMTRQPRCALSPGGARGKAAGAQAGKGGCRGGVWAAARLPTMLAPAHTTLHRPSPPPPPGQRQAPRPAATCLDLPLPLLAVGAHLAGRNAAHDLGQRLPAGVAALAHATQQRAEQLAFVRQAALVVLGGQAAAEAPHQVGLLGAAAPAGGQGSQAGSGGGRLEVAQLGAGLVSVCVWGGGGGRGGARGPGGARRPPPARHRRARTRRRVMHPPTPRDDAPTFCPCPAMMSASGRCSRRCCCPGRSCWLSWTARCRAAAAAGAGVRAASAGAGGAGPGGPRRRRRRRHAPGAPAAAAGRRTAAAPRGSGRCMTRHHASRGRDRGPAAPLP